MGASDFAPVSVLWTAWAASAAALTFPVQHWTIRNVANGPSGEARVRQALFQLVTVTAVVSLAVGGVAWWGRRPLFGRSDSLFPVLCAIVPFGCVAMGLVRGTLAGRRRYQATGMAIAAENVVRLGVALLAAAVAAPAGGFGLAVVAGFTTVFFWPTALHLRSGAQPIVAEPVREIAGIAGGSLVGQVVLTGGPVALAALGGRPEMVTSLFAALAVLRAPYMLATGVATRVTGPLTLATASRSALWLKQLPATLVLGSATAAVVIGSLAAWGGPTLLPLVFGDQVVLPPDMIGLVAAGSILALGSLGLSLILIAHLRTTLITLAWLGAGAVGAGFLVALPTGPLSRVVGAFVGAELTALLFLGAAAALVQRRREYTADAHE